jgi:hypothetical protein
MPGIAPSLPITLPSRDQARPQEYEAGDGQETSGIDQTSDVGPEEKS